MTQSPKPSSNHPLPASYVAHLQALVRQSLLAASLDPSVWEDQVVDAVRSVPLRRWTDLLAKGARLGQDSHPPTDWKESDPTLGRDATPQGSPSKPSFLGSRLPSYAISSTPTPSGNSLLPPSHGLTNISASGSTTPLEHPPSHFPLPTSDQLLAFLPRIPNYQRYPPPIDFDRSDVDDQLFSAARRYTRPRPGEVGPKGHVLPGTFPQAPSSPQMKNYGSLGSASSLGWEEEEEARLREVEAQERKACESKRAVLGLSVWIKDGPEGMGRVEFVEGEWALPAPHPCEEMDKADVGGGRSIMDGLPGKSLADKFLPLPTSPAKLPSEARGDLLYGLSTLDVSLDPESYHLFGGTFVLTLPADKSNSNTPSPTDHVTPTTPLQTSLQKIIRMALYTHASGILEVALLEAHCRPVELPPQRPSLFKGFSEQTLSVRSESRTRSSIDQARLLDAEKEGSGRWRKRKAKISKSWGGLLGVFTGSGFRDAEEDVQSNRERLFSSQSTVVVEGPPSSITRQPPPPPPSPQLQTPSGSLLELPPTSSCAASIGSSGGTQHGKEVSDSRMPPPMDKFSKSLASIQNYIFSTSPGVTFPPPPLLVRLRDAELRAASAPAASTSSYLTSQDANAVAQAFTLGGTSSAGDESRRLGERAPEGFRLTAEAKAGMGCLMMGNAGLDAFGRHQSISVLYQVLPPSHPSVLKTALSRTPAPTPPRSPALAAHKLDPLSSLYTSPNLSSPSSSLHSTTSNPPAPLSTSPTAPPVWQTLPYFTPDPTCLSASTFGNVIRTLSAETNSGVSTDHTGQPVRGPECVRVWMHAGVRVEAVSRKEFGTEVEDEEMEGVLVGREGEGGEGDEGVVTCWVEDPETGDCSAVRTLSEGAESISFAKYLELLIYSDQLFPPSFPSSPPLSFSPASTLSATPLIRHYRQRNVITSFSVSIFDVYEIRLGKLTVGPVKMPRHVVGSEDEVGEKEKAMVEDVQKEVEAFYVAVEKRISALKGRYLPGSPAPSTTPPPGEASSSPPVPKSPLPVSPAYAALHRLSLQFRENEASIIASLRSTSPSSLNDVRRSFSEKTKSAKAGMRDWEAEFDEQNGFPASMPPPEPEYVSNPKMHSLPGSSIVFNEDVPTSFIGHVLSEPKYVKEISKVKLPGITSGLTTPHVEDKSFDLSVSALSTPTPSALRNVSNVFTAPPSPSPISDTSCTTDLTRVETPKDFSNAIFSLRGLPTLQKKRSDASLALPSPGILPGRPGGNLFKTALTNEPTVSLGSAEGMLTVGGDPLDKLVKEISKTGKDLQDLKISDPSTDNSAHDPSEGKIHPLSALSHLSDLSSALGTPTKSTSRLSTNETPAREDLEKNGGSSSLLGLGQPSSAISSATKPARRSPSQAPPSAAPSGIFGWGSTKDESWTSSITSNIGSGLSMLVGKGPNGTIKGKKEPASRNSSIHSLLAPDHLPPSVTIEDKPHIVLTTTIGRPKKSLEISCTVYFASAFHQLRTRLGIEKSFAESLAQSQPWDAVGGKSKALFFRTADEKHIVKELVTKWNCSDMQALLEISPAYFDFILGSAAAKPTSFAKILGFYTYEIKDHSTSTSRKLDLLVMSNAFWDQHISQKFDLKGIENRRVRPVSGEGHPGDIGHDQEWREGQQVQPLLVHPHAKRILREAISNDVRFLSQNSVIDFSMLVGIDDDKKELVMNLVDWIGAYTVFKALESKGKLLAAKGGDVTVIPPDQYAARFEAAMDSYFVACPDKFTLPLSSKTTTKVAKSSIPSIF